VLKPPLNLSHDHFDGDRVVTAAGDDNICVALAGFNELQVHRLDSRQVLFDDLVQRTPTYMRVALDAPNESDVRVRVYEYFDITQIADTFVDEEKYPVDDDDVGRLDNHVVVPA
jgi:hypothetical protein